jgi:hypothetical protein
MTPTSRKKQGSPSHDHGRGSPSKTIIDDTVLGIGKKHIREELRSPFLHDDLILFQRPSRIQSRDDTGQSSQLEPEKLQLCPLCMMDILRFVLATGFASFWIGFFLLFCSFGLMDWTCHLALSLCDLVSSLADIWMGMVSFKKLYQMQRGSSAGLEAYDDRNNVSYAPVSKRMGWLNKGWLVLRLAPYPDLFTSPWLRWLNPIYSTFKDWQRQRTAARAYCELWHEGKLRADVHHICQFEHKTAALAEDTEYTFLEVDLWDWATWA